MPRLRGETVSAPSAGAWRAAASFAILPAERWTWRRRPCGGMSLAESFGCELTVTLLYDDDCFRGGLRDLTEESRQNVGSES